MGENKVEGIKYHHFPSFTLEFKDPYPDLPPRGKEENRKADF
jgi:hypothetical protein